jgi:hypothetical protein
MLALIVAFALVPQGLAIGRGKVDITPDVPLPLGGYTERGFQKSIPGGDRLYARTVLFESGATKIAVVSVETLTIPESLVREVKKRIPTDVFLFLAATHTHSAPDSQMLNDRMTFAIPGILAERIVNAAITGKPLTFSRLGVHMTSVKDGTKFRIAVKDVVDPAKAAGIQRQDILLAIEDTEILDGAQLKNYLVERTNPGQEVSIKVRRLDADLTFHVVLGGG